MNYMKFRRRLVFRLGLVSAGDLHFDAVQRLLHSSCIAAVCNVSLNALAVVPCVTYRQALLRKSTRLSRVLPRHERRRLSIPLGLEVQHHQKESTQTGQAMMETLKVLPPRLEVTSEC